MNIDYDVLDACLASYPESPAIDPATTPHTPERLAEIIDYCMWLSERLAM